MGRRAGVAEEKKSDNLQHVFLTFLKLGLTSFGGPIAHIGYFRTEFVGKRKWLSDAQFSEFSALCHFLPGPSSSQLGMMLGLLRAGVPGTFAAWLGFTLPSAVIMLGVGLGVIGFQDHLPAGLILGLKILAVAVVLQALMGMAKSLTPDIPRLLIAGLACVGVLVMPGALFQPLVILCGGILGYVFLQQTDQSKIEQLDLAVSKKMAVICLSTFFILLAALPFISLSLDLRPVQIMDGFYRSGALVFGGGHVVLPLLNGETVENGLLSQDAFLAGYAAAQALPGPLFTFASYLGALMGTGGGAVMLSALALIAIFMPAFLLVFGVLPFWAKVRQAPNAWKILSGVNAAVVGLLAAILYDPLWTSAILNWVDLAFFAVAFLCLYFGKIPLWLCVMLSAGAGAMLL